MKIVKDWAYFVYTCRKFLTLTMKNLEEDIFYGPQIRKVIKDLRFQDSLDNAEACAWWSFMLLVRNLLETIRQSTIL